MDDNYIHDNGWDEITCSFTNFNGGCNHLAIMGLKLIQVFEKGPVDFHHHLYDATEKNHSPATEKEKHWLIFVLLNLS